MSKYDTWQVFWLKEQFKCLPIFTIVALKFKLLRTVASTASFYSYGDSAGFTPASLLILCIEAEKPNSLQM